MPGAQIFQEDLRALEKCPTVFLCVLVFTFYNLALNMVYLDSACVCVCVCVCVYVCVCLSQIRVLYFLHSGPGPEKVVEKRYLQRQQTIFPEYCQTIGQLTKQSRY